VFLPHFARIYRAFILFEIPIFCLVKIDTLHISTLAPDLLAAFYVKHFGVTSFPENGNIGLQFGWSKLILQPSEREHRYHFALNIPSDQVENARTFLKTFTDLLPDPDTGSEVIDFTSWNAHSIYFRDPAGNIVELIARHNLKDRARGGFRPECLRCISEIGTASESVKNSFDALHHGAGIARYSGNFTTFCAAGDEEGLVILTELDRNWFPTDTPSLPEPWSMCGERHGKAISMEFRDGVLEVNQ